MNDVSDKEHISLQSLIGHNIQEFCHASDVAQMTKHYAEGEFCFTIACTDTKVAHFLRDWLWLWHSAVTHQLTHLWRTVYHKALFYDRSRSYCIHGGTASAAPLPFGPGNPAFCGSCPLVTPYYCRLGDLLCYTCMLYLSTILCVYAYVYFVFSLFFVLFSFTAFSFSTSILLVLSFDL